MTRQEIAEAILEDNPMFLCDRCKNQDKLREHDYCVGCNVDNEQELFELKVRT